MNGGKQRDTPQREVDHQQGEDGAGAGEEVYIRETVEWRRSDVDQR